MSLSYVNASMNEPLILTRAPDGYRIKPVISNFSVVGIIDLDEVKVETLKLFNGDMIFLSTDGVNNAVDENDVALGTTKRFENTVRDAASKNSQGFIEEVSDLIADYTKNSQISDDITMVVAKVER